MKDQKNDGITQKDVSSKTQQDKKHKKRKKHEKKKQHSSSSYSSSSTSSSFSSKERRKKKKSHSQKSLVKRKSKHNKRKLSDSYSFSSNDSFSSYEARRKKHKKKYSSRHKKKKAHRQSNTLKSKMSKKLEDDVKNISTYETQPSQNDTQENKTEEKKSMVPMTKEEYEKQQSIIRRVYDEGSGRYRLVRGSGEIIEELVSRQMHERINSISTANDGMSFARQIARKSNYS